METNVRPLELQWSEWTTICRTREAKLRAVAHEPSASAERLLAVISDWNRITRAWIAALTENRKRDLISLAQAEAHFLWTQVHDERRAARAEHLEDLRFDFRRRWHDLVPLALMLNGLGIADVTIDDVSAEAHDCGWLP